MLDVQFITQMSIVASLEHEKFSVRKNKIIFPALFLSMKILLLLLSQKIVDYKISNMNHKIQDWFPINRFQRENVRKNLIPISEKVITTISIIDMKKKKYNDFRSFNKWIRTLRYRNTSQKKQKKLHWRKRRILGSSFLYLFKVIPSSYISFVSKK